MAKVTRKHNYSDLDLDFFPNPSTGDVSKKVGVEAIKRSIRNLILTNFYDRKFNHGLGSGATKLLFENITQFTAIFLKNAIMEVIENFEPRVRLIDDTERAVIVNADIDRNGYNVTINFIVLNRQEPSTITIFLERIR